MWALHFLKLDTNADTKLIKRAYARLLKQTRPDEDPVAFQQLNEAYQAALSWRKENPLFQDFENDTDISNITELIASDSDIEEQETYNIALSETDKMALSNDDHNSFYSLYKHCMRLIFSENSDELQSWLLRQVESLNELQKNTMAALFIEQWQKYHTPVAGQYFDWIADILNFEKNLQQTELRHYLNTIWQAKQYKPNQRENNETSQAEDRLDNIITVNIEELCQQCINAARLNDPHQLKQWLYAKQELWSIEIQQVIGKYLIQTLSDYPIGIHKDCFEIMHEFFDFNTVFNHINYEYLYELRQYLHSLWVFDKKNIERLTTTNEKPIKRFFIGSTSTDNKLSKQLYSPFSWIQATFASFPITKAKQFAYSVAELLYEAEDTIPDCIDYRQINFWLSFNSPGLNSAKLLHWTVFFLALFVITLPVSAFIWYQIINILPQSVILAVFFDVITISMQPVVLLFTLLCLWYYLWSKTSYYGIYNVYARLISIFVITLPISIFVCYQATYLFSHELIVEVLCIIGLITILCALALVILLCLWYCLWLKTPYYSIHNVYARLVTIVFIPVLCIISVGLYFINNDYVSYAFILVIALLNVLIKLMLIINKKLDIPPLVSLIMLYFIATFISIVFIPAIASYKITEKQLFLIGLTMILIIQHKIIMHVFNCIIISGC